MEINDEKINKILEKSKKYREQLASNMNSFINTEKELADFEEVFEENFKKDIKNIDLNDKNNVFLKCKISEQEALDGCTKKIKYNCIREDGKKENNIINVKIPKGIQKDQSIVIYGDGNYIKELDKRSNIIIKVEIK